MGLFGSTKRSKQVAGDHSSQYQAEQITVHNYELDSQSTRASAMKILIAAYHDEQKKGGDSSFQGFIDKISHYNTVIDPVFVGLEKKLEDGLFSNDFEWALRLKQDYSKTLQRTKFFPAAQKIHAYLLAKVYTLFQQYVYDAIKDGAAKEVVRKLINEKVIGPIEDLVNQEGNVLELYSDDINAMIYFLTGNCHLKWK
jgi:hypothetical protein